MTVPKTGDAPGRLFVMVGLPGAGKTTRARELEAERGALRLTPDEWMLPLFGDSDADGRRDVLEGRFVWLALRALTLGIDVILDFGVWSRDERDALRSLAASVGATCELIYLSVEPEEQARRVARRGDDETSVTFAISPDELARYAERFQVPERIELEGSALAAAPEGFATWLDWAAQRWPTSTMEPPGPTSGRPSSPARG